MVGLREGYEVIVIDRIFRIFKSPLDVVGPFWTRGSRIPTRHLRQPTGRDLLLPVGERACPRSLLTYRRQRMVDNHHTVVVFAIVRVESHSVRH